MKRIALYNKSIIKYDRNLEWKAARAALDVVPLACSAERRGKVLEERGTLRVAILAACVLLGFSTQSAHAAVVADFVFIIDRSGSMCENGELKAVKAKLVQFNQAMVANGIDARYSIVAFGGRTSIVADLLTFDEAFGPGGPITRVKSWGPNPENGSSAVVTALADLHFRPDAVTNVVLFTDEDDDSPAGMLQQADQALTDHNAFFNVVGATGKGNTDRTYGVLAERHGGKVFNIRKIHRSADALFADIINTKVQEVLESPIPEPATMVLLAAGGLVMLSRKRRSC